MTIPRIALDGAGRPPRGAKAAFAKVRRAENAYARQLRKIAQHIGDLVTGLWQPDDLTVSNLIGAALERYAQILEPWANAVGARMVAEVQARDLKAWRSVSAEMATTHRHLLEETDIGDLVRQRMADQVDLITSLPRDAAQRVHKLTLEGLTNGTRASEIAKEIGRTGEVTKSRATLIARTEVGRTSTEFTRARAETVGSTHFVWRTAKDSDVRPTHRVLDGKTFAWNDPPECDPGHHSLPGAIWNCRCYAEPVF